VVEVQRRVERDLLVGSAKNEEQLESAPCSRTMVSSKGRTSGVLRIPAAPDAC
jgi:hypothetical protein